MSQSAELSKLVAWKGNRLRQGHLSERPAMMQGGRMTAWAELQLVISDIS